MKRFKLLIFIFITIFIFISCNNKIDNNESDKDKEPPVEEQKEPIINEYKISTALNYPDSYLYNQMTLSCEELNIPVFNCKTNFSHYWNAEAPQRMNNGVAIINIEGSVKLKITTVFNLNNKCVIRPLVKDIKFNFIDNYNIEFVIEEVGQYTIELSNDRTLHLFVNRYNEYENYRDTKEYQNYIYFGPGVHNKDNSTYINQNNLINLSNNTLVFIDEGAVVEAGFIANEKENITIVGYGIVSGACFDRSATKNTKLIPYEFNYCKNLIFYGVATLDPAGWCYNLYFSSDIILDNIKIISSRSNGDGVSIQSCKNVKCINSFVRSWDDSLVVKNYPKWVNRNIEGETENIYFYNCVLWTDLAQSMEIGYETVGEKMENITFEKITVLHNFHKAPISIHNGNNANIKNVLYKDIIIEDADMGKGDGRNILIEITAEFSSTWSNGHKETSLGSVDGVKIINVKVLDADNPLISLRGSIDARGNYSDDIHYVSNVEIENVVICGEKLDENYNNLEMVYTDNIIFK